MKVCYQCFVRSGRNPIEWDLIFCDDTKRERCEVCGLIGLYVRNVASVEKKDEHRRLEN